VYDIGRREQHSPALFDMNRIENNPEDLRLRELLHEAHPAPELPPRFQEGVWRRIEHNDAPAESRAGWLETLAALVLRPRWAMATVAVAVLAGVLSGMVQGQRLADRETRDRYVASVSPMRVAR
jgi:hypothetical protein